MQATFFPTKYDFRKWLEQNAETEAELLVGYYKVNSGKPSMSWSESVDQALCFGWIDGVRRSIDSESYCIRFTPRRKNSIWSDIDIRKVEELTRAGLMTPAGLTAFSFRKEQKSGIYSFENKYLELDSETENYFKKQIVAWENFSNKAPSYQKRAIHWIMSAKQEKTKLSRLEQVIKDCENC